MISNDVVQKSSLQNCILAVNITFLLSPPKLGLYPRLLPRPMCRGRGGTSTEPPPPPSTWISSLSIIPPVPHTHISFIYNQRYKILATDRLVK
jgi:hypothetical protein